MRTPVLTAILAIGLAATTAQAETVREQSRFEQDANGVTAVRIENTRGLVDVRASADGRLKIVALKIARSPSASVARELAKGTIVETDLIDGEFQIRVRYPKHRIQLTLWDDLSNSSIPNVEVRLAIEVPARLPAIVTTASGDVATHGIEGRQKLRTASGDVTIDGAGVVDVATASGEVTAGAIRTGQIQTVSGDVKCVDPHGELDVQTTSGDIHVDGAGDSLRVRTVSGQIHLDRAPHGLDLESTSGGAEVGESAGHVSMRSVSGDLEVRLAEPLSEAEITSQSGTLTLDLDSRVACALRATSSSGEINFRMPVQARTLSRGQVSATVRGGTTPVHLRTVSGDINVMGGGR
jgi:DUF4097 and DUF4098 domain-containing protein YvlB